MTNNEVEYKNSTTAIFSAYYFVEGANNSLFSIIIPIYLILNYGSIQLDQISSMASIIMLPWIMKLIYGLIGDKISLGKFGRRKPWILFPGIIAGIAWISIPLLLNTGADPISVFTIAGIFASLGLAFGDTSLDGMMLDNTPKDKLGTVQGYCWGFKSVGVIAGGPIIAVFLTLVRAEDIFIFFGILILIFSFFPLLIKEQPLQERVITKGEIKKMFTTGRNWRVFGLSVAHTLSEGVFGLYLAYFLLISLNLVIPDGLEISAKPGGDNLYIVQGNINVIIGLGIIAGAIIGGKLCDKKSRRLSLNIGYIVNVICCLLVIIDGGIIFILVSVIIIGATMGWKNAVYSAILGEYSQNYEMDSTFYSIGTSFANLGIMIGLALTSRVFPIFVSTTTSTNQLYDSIFLMMAIMIAIAPIVFMLLNPKDYELKKED